MKERYREVRSVLNALEIYMHLRTAYISLKFSKMATFSKVLTEFSLIGFSLKVFVNEIFKKYGI